MMRSSSLPKRAAAFALAAAMTCLMLPAAAFGAGTFGIEVHKYQDTSWTGGTAGDGTEITPPTGAQPLENVEFKAYKVVAGHEADVDITAEKVAADKGTYLGAGAAPAGTETTAANGTASFTGLDEGLYYVEETDNAAVATKAAPFLVRLPMNINGTLASTVHVYPKNTVEGAPPVDKGGHVEPGAQVGDTVDWYVKVGVPEDYATGKKLVVSDTIDARLAYVANSATVGVGATQAAATPVAFTEAIAGAKVTWTIDAAALNGMAVAAGDSIWVKFQTKIVTIDGNPIPNQAHVDYTNSLGATVSGDSGTNPVDPDGPGPNPPIDPEIGFGDLDLTKVDKKDNAALAGAQFELYTKAADGSYVKVAAFGTQTSDANGKIAYADLAEGTYYLKEVKAPAGYEAPADGTYTEFTVEKDAGTGSYDVLKTISNTMKGEDAFLLPITGGMGVIPFAAAGILLIGGGLYLVARSRKRDAA
ncbi:SpaH/EbpB family LPXTG-anchored major pilin [Eggerthella timonensis]|uniref:SpaH/EbpB family LPXTG-anchored major pilin n=1 Tax=Eggerthella timonensis TaxID=1871008 RepID=UPI000C756B4C|nr:SpaH/EbpB family LPXTG-anchored major pilin [Eggerthella timonensis]